MDKITQFFKRKLILKKGILIDMLSENGKNELNNILLTFSPTIIGNKIDMICNLIKYDVDGNWIDKINNSNKFGKDSSSLESYIVRYGEYIGPKLFQLKNEKSVINKEKYLKTHTEDEWVALCKSKSNWGLDRCIAKYGEIDGPVKWQLRLNKKTETQRKKRESGYVYKNGRTLYEYQLKHGVEMGYKLWEKRNIIQKYRFSEQYYIDTYGERVGKLKYQKYIERLIKQRSGIGSYSKISQLLFWELYNRMSEEHKQLCRFAELNGEELIYVNSQSIKVIKPDFKCGNKIIEFDGTYWHSFISTIENDKIKDSILVTKNYKILRILESDYKADKNIVIQKCMQFLND